MANSKRDPQFGLCCNDNDDDDDYDGPGDEQLTGLGGWFPRKVFVVTQCLAMAKEVFPAEFLDALASLDFKLSVSQ